jgi:uncharacterized protein
MSFTWLLQSRVAHRLSNFLAAMALLYVSICVYFWATQVSKILAPLPDLSSHPTRMGMPCEDILIPLPPAGKQPGEPLHAFWVPAENPDAPVFLYLHGQDATRGKNLEHTETFHQCGYQAPNQRLISPGSDAWNGVALGYTWG